MFYDWFSLLVSTVKKLVWNLINGKRLWKKLILLYQPIWDKKKMCVVCANSANNFPLNVSRRAPPKAK